MMTMGGHGAIIESIKQGYREIGCHVLLKPRSVRYDEIAHGNVAQSRMRRTTGKIDFHCVLLNSAAISLPCAPVEVTDLEIIARQNGPQSLVFPWYSWF